MPKITGEVTKIEKDRGENKPWLVYIEGISRPISGFGKFPENIEEGKECDIVYHTKKVGDKTYYNYGKEKIKKESKNGVRLPQEYWDKKQEQMIRMSVVKFLSGIATDIEGKFEEKNEKCKQAKDYWYEWIATGKEKKKKTEDEDAKAFMDD